MNGDNDFKTREQQFAQKAYECVNQQLKSNNRLDYKRFAKRFPALIHTCGLAQSLSFAQAKQQHSYLNDLSQVSNFGISDEKSMDAQIRAAAFTDYLRYTRILLNAANWLKRYAEALIIDDKEDEEDESNASMS